MKKIEGTQKNLKQLLQNTKYSIGYYQREYKWKRENMEELIGDLTSEFLEYYTPGDNREEVADYGAYFMGSVILTGRENDIIDGQQRFTSMTLLLIYLNNRLKNLGQHYAMIDAMIFSESYGKKSFNIDVPGRSECMDALYNDKPFEATKSDESVQNLYNRFQEINEMFPEAITDDMLFHFCDWLAEKVFFIEIVASAEQDAHKVFVTMNDRGLSLTSTEMLKGYLLSEIKSDENREKLNDLWKARMLELHTFDPKGDENFLKAWLRAQYAITIRATKAKSDKEDFDIIGGEFHKWVREERQKIGLNNSEDFEEFIMRIDKFSKIFLKIKAAEATFNPEMKYVYYNGKVNFTNQSMLLLAPICYEDTEDVINEKINLVARFIDLLIIARTTNYRSVDYNTIKNYVFNVTKDIRTVTVDELKAKLLAHYNKLEYNVADTIRGFGLNSFTKSYIKHMLARVTSFIEESIGVAPGYVNYMCINTKNPFEIEHVLPDHYEWFTDEYSDQEDFKRWRNNIGGLLLLHKSINASLNDKKYDYKINKYCSAEGNIYTESLGEQAYINNPQFVKFVKSNKLSFEPYDKFGKDEISKRNKLFAELVALIWNDKMFRME